MTDNSVDKNTQLTLSNIIHKKITGLALIDESEVDIRLGWDWGDYTLFQVKVYRSVSFLNSPDGLHGLDGLVGRMDDLRTASRPSRPDLNLLFLKRKKGIWKL